MFELAGHSLEYTTNPREGIDRALSNAFDIVAIDLVMPDIHGLEVFRQIQNRNPAVPMAIFTGEGTINEGEIDGLSPKPLILHKPFDISDIEAACFDEINSPLQLVPTITEKDTELPESSSVNKYEHTSDGYVIQKLDELSRRVPHTLFAVFKWLESDLLLKYLKGVGINPGQSIEQMERQIF
jgi:two-component system OmpR family response regulator